MIKIAIARPMIDKTPTALVVDLQRDRETARVVRGMEFIVDFDRFDDLVGIEILDFKKQAGPTTLDGLVATTIDSEAYVSHDSDVDAFYLRVSIPTGVRRPVSTRCMRGTVELDVGGRLLRLSASA